MYTNNSNVREAVITDTKAYEYSSPLRKMEIAASSGFREQFRSKVAKQDTKYDAHHEKQVFFNTNYKFKFTDFCSWAAKVLPQQS